MSLDGPWATAGCFKSLIGYAAAEGATSGIDWTAFSP